MGSLDFFWHLAGFLAPAAGVALLVSLSARVLFPGRGGAWLTAWVLDFVAGAAALLAGLWLSGRDGSMLGYAAMALAVATSQWLLARNWK
ncbi:MAG: hypothetical protein H7322_08290 [Ramlibacter sp.]|nr:hypothetical protein [Ramlibacter sp.]